MKFGPVTKLDQKDRQNQINLTMISFQKIGRHYHFSDLWPISRDPEARVSTHDL